MTQLVPGEMIVRKDGRDDFLAVGEELVEITSDRVAIVTDMAVPVENIDEAKAEEARQRAAPDFVKSFQPKKLHRSTPR